MEIFEWEIVRQMKQRKVYNPLKLTEFDQWVNDATRKDINFLLDQYDGELFGLKIWEMEILEGEELRDCRNFSVSYIFLKKHRHAIETLINDYKADKIPTLSFLDKLGKLAVYTAWWV